MTKQFLIAAVLLVLAIHAYLPAEASGFICYNCRSTSQKNCSTEEALDKNNIGFTKDCTSRPTASACYVRITFKNEKEEEFVRGCAGTTICPKSTLEYECTTGGNTTTCKTCCTGNYCNNKVNLTLPGSGSTRLKSAYLLSMVMLTVLAMFS